MPVSQVFSHSHRLSWGDSADGDEVRTQPGMSCRLGAGWVTANPVMSTATAPDLLSAAPARGATQPPSLAPQPLTPLTWYLLGPMAAIHMPMLTSSPWTGMGRVKRSASAQPAPRPVQRVKKLPSASVWSSHTNPWQCERGHSVTAGGCLVKQRVLQGTQRSGTDGTQHAGPATGRR